LQDNHYTNRNIVNGSISSVVNKTNHTIYLREDNNGNADGNNNSAGHRFVTIPPGHGVVHNLSYITIYSPTYVKKGNFDNIASSAMAVDE
jgi:hypothetical protein